MMKDLKVNGKINIESFNDQMSIEVEGNGLSLMYILAELSEVLVKESNLDKDDILFAVNLGLKKDEKIKKINDEIKEKKMDKLTDQLAEMLKDALVGSDM